MVNRATPLQAFRKTISKTPVTIGEPFSYTITADLFGARTYTNTILTDTIPTIAGTRVFSITAVEIGNENSVANTWLNGPTNGSVLTFTTSSSPSGTVVGPDLVTITITGIISNVAAATNNKTFTNTLNLSYNDDGQPYAVTAAVTGTIREPALTIAKSASPTSNIKAGDEVTYTIFVTHAAASKATAYDVVVQDIIPAVLTYKPSSLQAPGASATFESSQQISATYAALALGAGLTITYVVTVDTNAQPSSALTNTAAVSYTSMPGANPDERTGSGVAPNNYLTNTQATVQTADLSLSKSLVEPRVYTIGEAITYTLNFTVPTGLARSVVLTDSVPAGLRYDASASFIGLTAPFVLPSYTITQNPADGGNGSGASSFTLGFGGDLNNTTGAPALVSLTFRLIVANVAASNHGDVKVNTAVLTYRDADNNVETKNASAPPVTLVEPLLVMQKSVSPAAARPGDVVFYDVQLYHATTSTVPAYNVAITDIVPTGIGYIANSWQQTTGPSADQKSDLNSPALTAGWSVVPITVTQANPIRFRFNGVIAPSLPSGTAITNTITGTWTSLLDDPFGDRRDGSGGVDDYRTSASAAVALSEVDISKTGPLTATAGSVITYQLSVKNQGPYAAIQAIVSDTMPFQMISNSVTATFIVPGGNSGACVVTPAISGTGVRCSLGDIPLAAIARIVVTGTVDPNTPLGADLTNVANFSVSSPDGSTLNNTISVDTEVYTLADVGVRKTGPSSVTAGQTVSYTIVVSNTGPSTARTVDMKDILPAGVTYSGGSSTQGACVSGICQLGDVAVGQAITMVVTGTVGSNVTGTITNTAQTFAATADTNATNNSSSASSTVNTSTQLQIVKNDLTDPVYAGDTYLYEIVITNTGPSDALNVVITDALPSYVSFVGGSPDGCAHSGTASGGVVTCTVGTLAAGASRDYLINVRLDPTVITGTVGTNTVRVATTTPIAAGSVLADTELTTDWAKTGGLTDLVLSKSVTPASAIAGSGRITYTVIVTNSGPSLATAVQVVDALPREFRFVSAAVAGGVTGAVCNSGVTCDLLSLAVDQRVTITIVADVPANVIMGTYINTATVSSANFESNTANNTAGAATAVSQNAALQVRKAANPATATAGQALAYTILVTNTGPSDAANVTVADTLPVGFNLALVTPSQGGCVGFPCNLGTVVAGGNASVYLYGTVSTNVTGTLTNTVSVSSATSGTGATFTLTTPISGTADLALVKTATATARPGDPVTYTLTVYNLGPSQAQNVRITDTLPVSVVFGSASTGCTNANGIVTCALASLAVGASSSFIITTTASASIQEGVSLENTAVVGSSTPDGNASNNNAVADTSIIGAADMKISKVGTPATAIAGQYVTYTIVITNTGPGQARSVDVKDQLPAGLTLASISASDGGVCAGAVCQFGTLSINATRTITVVAKVASDTATGAVSNTAAVYSTDETNQGNNTATAQTTITTSADLAITKSVAPAPAVPGQSLLYVLTVRNAGPSDAREVVVTDTLPVGFTPTSISSSQGGCSALPCTLGTLGAGGSASVSIQGTVAATVTASLVNLAGVSSSTPDPGSANNTTSVTAAVSPLADLALALSSTPTATGGQTATVTATVTNLGPSAASGTVVTITLPPGTTFNQRDAAGRMDGGEQRRRHGDDHDDERADAWAGRQPAHRRGCCIGGAAWDEPAIWRRSQQQHAGSVDDEQQRQRRHIGSRGGGFGLEQDRPRHRHRGSADHVHDRGDEPRAVRGAVGGCERPASGRRKPGVGKHDAGGMRRCGVPVRRCPSRQCGDGDGGGAGGQQCYRHAHQHGDGL